MTPFVKADGYDAERMERTRDSMIRDFTLHPEKLREILGEIPTAEAIRDMVNKSIGQSMEAEVWINDKYQVAIHHDCHVPPGWPAMVHLSIRRLDRDPVRDWRDLQEIKNQLVGVECEGVELFPAESRLVDSANQFHLFCLTEAGCRFPFGFQVRYVDYSSLPTTKQRPQEK